MKKYLFALLLLVIPLAGFMGCSSTDDRPWSEQFGIPNPTTVIDAIKYADDPEDKLAVATAAYGAAHDLFIGVTKAQLISKAAAETILKADGLARQALEAAGTVVYSDAAVAVRAEAATKAAADVRAFSTQLEH